MTERVSTAPINSFADTWPPVASTQNRVRGFYDQGVVRTSADVNEFGESLETCVADLGPSLESDRLSVRLVTSMDAVALLDGAGHDVEVAIPFGYDGEELALTYIARNPSDRVISKTALASHRLLLRNVVQGNRDTTDPVAQLEAKGYTPHLLDSATPPAQRAALVDKFTDLYSVFDYDRAFVDGLLSNPANVIAYIEDGSTIISTAMAEEAVVNIRGLGPLNLLEITESVTHPEHRGRGLFKATYDYLVSRLLAERARGERAIDVLYIENNLAMQGIIRASHGIGHRYNHFDAERFGLHNPGFGILQQSFSVNDGVETRPYNDFAVSYMPLDPTD